MRERATQRRVEISTNGEQVLNPTMQSATFEVISFLIDIEKAWVATEHGRHSQPLQQAEVSHPETSRAATQSSDRDR